MRLNIPLHVVVMAKSPVAGRVKTRLIGHGPGFLTAHQAAEVHEAMAQCVMQRLEEAMGPAEGVRFVLALADETQAVQIEPQEHVTVVRPKASAKAAELAAPPGWLVVGQGAGDLGSRLRSVWQRLGGGPAIFFGTDSPDVPREALAGISTGLTTHELAIGPTEDGGYWAIAAVRYLPQLFTGIDWGTPRVYHQTLEAAKRAGRSVHVLPRWQDVDEPGDLATLRRRLGDTCEPALRMLGQRLASILTPTDGPTGMTTNPTDISAAPRQQSASDEPDLSNSLLLIVDDNEQNVELLQAYLETLPCRIDVAYDGVEAINRVESDDLPMPDLILLDVMMPKMSGFEVCRHLKSNPKTRSIPIMMVTALNELGDIERGVESGTDDFLSKPVNKLELVTRVKSLLRVRHLKRELDRTEAYIRDMERSHNHGG